MPRTHTPKKKKQTRKLDARRDTLDFRDRMFEPTLIEVPRRIDVAAYREWNVPVLDQGQEGACTGFGLATVANYLLRKRKDDRDLHNVSARMLYDMARRYDEWPGEDYDGSSARGAMKGWHKHGVCGETAYPSKGRASGFSRARAEDALHRPLGAYYRVNHKDLVAMHTALAEVGVLYATCDVHDGWDEVGKSGIIPFRPGTTGGHAFAIVAYDEDGVWIQNSWGATWGKGGLGRVAYDDWLQNGSDVWVARLGAPVKLDGATSTATGIASAAQGSRAYVFRDLRPHVVSLGNDGELRPGGTYGTSEGDVKRIFEHDFPELTASWPKAEPKRLLLYAHGGLVGEDSAIQHVAEYRAAMLPLHIYPLTFVWKTDYWSTLLNILRDALRGRRSEGFLDAAKDFMLDRLDDALEPAARALSGKSEWDEMKENAQLATTSARGGARLVARYVAELMRRDKSVELHVVGHSAGSILNAYLVQALTASKAQGGLGLTLSTCTLWAPACTLQLFEQTYLPAIERKAIERFALFTLTDAVEQDDSCAKIYHKSLLYLVSNAFEQKPRIPGFRDGVPLLGMEKFVGPWDAQHKLFRAKRADWVRAPNDRPVGSRDASRAHAHGDFDDDRTTLQATIARVRGAASDKSNAVLRRSGAARAALRKQLEHASGT